MIKTNCLYCKKSFYYYPSDNRKYCSHKCFELSRCGYKKYRSKKWLYEQYITKGLSSPKIAKICDCKYSIILKWLKKHGIKIRTTNESLKNWWSFKENKKKMIVVRSGKRSNLFGKTREKSSQWKGGKIINTNGYILIMKADHPNSNHSGYVPEHRLIAEKALGRYLRKNEIVHHGNQIRDDNRNCNLVICTKGYHKWLHHRMGTFLSGL